MDSAEEEIDYGSDFEEASDEDGRKTPQPDTMRSTSRKLKTFTLESSKESTPPDVLNKDARVPPIAPAPVDRAPLVEQNGVAEFSSSGNIGKRPGRRSGYENSSGKPPPFGGSDGTFERSATNNSGLGTPGSGRLVRGKISVSNESDGTRPGTGESAGKSAPSKPMWLQHDEGAHSHLPRHNQNHSPLDFSSERSRNVSGDRNRKSAEIDFSVGRRNQMSADMELEGRQMERAGTADGDQRKVKRLQQEIQRLTQRLKESEIYSAPDDGLPIFSLDEVELGSQIAQGGFSSVHYATWKSTTCALKKIFDPVITAELRAEFENEVKMLRRLRHPNIITLMAVCRQPPALSILTECVGGGSLFELLHGPPQTKSLDCEPKTILPFMLQTSLTLAYLHAMLVVHRDIKSHNVLLTLERPAIAKLCDFGLARAKADLGTGTMQYAGTPCYMAPELFAQRKYAEGVDVFAFGVMLWETLSTEIPHANMDPSDIAHRVQTKDYAGLTVVHSWSKTSKNLLRTLLAVQADDRPAMTAVTEQVRQIITELPPSDW